MSTPNVSCPRDSQNLQTLTSAAQDPRMQAVRPSAAMDRLPLPLPFNPSELLWRYPLPFNHPPPSPALDFKAHLPAALASDPRIWTREDVATFLKWCEREFDLPHFNMDMFQMNGKALCLLGKADLAERSPGAGDVLYNAIQLLVRDAQNLQRCLPSSPVTPTSRHHYPLSPHTAPPGWNPLLSGDFQAPSLIHLVHQGNSVTLSPAPSVDSQSGSPQHADHNTASSYHSGSNGSNQSDSDEDSYPDGNTGLHNSGSPPSTPGAGSVAPPLPQPQSPNKEIILVNQSNNNPANFRNMHREFFQAETPEPNTNGRLLWDFLQQLLNDPTQRYTNYIAWKNRETGVFKIVDPAGLAKLWGIQKNHLSMNYDKMSRALRYYYRVNILRKVQGERHCYQFLRNPSELKNIKNMSLLRQQMSPTRPISSLPPQAHLHTPGVNIKVEPEADTPDDLIPPVLNMENPTDLSMDHPTDLSMDHPTDLSPTRPQFCKTENQNERSSFCHSEFNGVHIKNDVTPMTTEVSDEK